MLIATHNFNSSKVRNITLYLQLRKSSKIHNLPGHEPQIRDPRLCDRRHQEQLLSSSTTFVSGEVMLYSVVKTWILIDVIGVRRKILVVALLEIAITWSHPTYDTVNRCQKYFPLFPGNADTSIFHTCIHNLSESKTFNPLSLV